METVITDKDLKELDTIALIELLKSLQGIKDCLEGEGNE